MTDIKRQKYSIIFFIDKSESDKYHEINIDAYFSDEEAVNMSTGIQSLMDVIVKKGASNISFSYADENGKIIQCAFSDVRGIITDIPKFVKTEME